MLKIPSPTSMDLPLPFKIIRLFQFIGKKSLYHILCKILARGVLECTRSILSTRLGSNNHSLLIKTQNL